jgi:hypothetical protein
LKILILRNCCIKNREYFELDKIVLLLRKHLCITSLFNVQGQLAYLMNLTEIKQAPSIFNNFLEENTKNIGLTSLKNREKKNVKEK